MTGVWCGAFIKIDQQKPRTVVTVTLPPYSVFFIAALVWLFMSLVIRIISALAGDLFDPTLMVLWPPDVK